MGWTTFSLSISLMLCGKSQESSFPTGKKKRRLLRRETIFPLDCKKGTPEGPSSSPPFYVMYGEGRVNGAAFDVDLKFNVRDEGECGWRSLSLSLSQGELLYSPDE